MRGKNKSGMGLNERKNDSKEIEGRIKRKRDKKKRQNET